jgi:hypothetical protein
MHWCTYACSIIPAFSAPKRKTVAGLVGIHGRDISSVVDGLAKCRLAAYRSFYMYDRFKDMTDTPLVYIPDAIDTDMFTPPLNPDYGRRFTVGWNGNPSKKDKRYGDIEYAMKRIPRIVFAPNLKPDHGSVPYSEIPKVYHGWDCYVCYSSEEGFCIPIIEAAASGIPVVSSDVGCAKRLGGGAIIVNSLKELSNAVEYLRDNRDRALAMGRIGRDKVVKQFDWKVVARMYDELFQSMLSDKPVQTSVFWKTDGTDWAFSNLAERVSMATMDTVHVQGLVSPIINPDVKVLFHPDQFQTHPPDMNTIVRLDSNRWYE